MKFCVIFCCSLIIFNNAQENSQIEETTLELCANNTDDSCEAINVTEPITTQTTTEVTSTTVQSKKPKNTTPKSVYKQASNVTTPLKPNAGCTCDDTRGECEVNCCCDVDCSREQKAVFTHCIPLPIIVDRDRCWSPQLLHHNNSGHQAVLTESGVLCVVVQNTVQSTDFTDVHVLRTASAFQKKLGRRRYYAWPNLPLMIPTFNDDISYEFNSPIWITDNASIFQLEFPTSIGLSPVCHSVLAPKYLEDTFTTCTRRISSKSECIGSEEVLRFNVISCPRLFNFTQIQDCTEDICVPILQFLCVNATCNESLIPRPVFNETNGVCENVIESVEYKVYHNGTQGILDVKAYFRLKNISISTDQFIRKKYSVLFMWAVINDQPVFKRSGKPGYEIGKPVISGRKTLQAVVFNFTTSDWINVGTAGHSGHCHKRQNLLFGENIKTWCLLHVEGNCKEIQQQIWQQLLGPASNQSATVVSSYGDPYTKAQEWVPILSAPLPPSPALITAVDIVIVHSLIGPIASPQAKIIGVYLNPVPSPSLVCNSNKTAVVAIETSVRFIDKTTPAITKFASPPVYEIKLPQDFFYPFFSASGRNNVEKECVVLVFIMIFFN